MKEYPKNEENQHQINEQDAEYNAYQAEDDERLRQHLLLSYTDKYKLFRKMMRIGKMLASAKITHQA